MLKEKVLFKKVSWSKGKLIPCLFCGKQAKWEVSLNGSFACCCGNKHCRKQAEKIVS